MFNFLLSVSDNAEDALTEAYTTFRQVMVTVLPILIGVLLVVGIFYGVQLGIKFAKAEDTDAREKAKTQLINLAIGIGVATVIAVVCWVLVETNAFQGAFTSSVKE